MPDQVHLATVRSRTTLTARMSGELDMATIAACRAQLNDAVYKDDQRGPTPRPSDSGLRRVVVDLSALKFLSVGGLRMLADFADTLADHDVAVTLAVPPDGPVHRIIDLAKLNGRAAIEECSSRATRGVRPREPATGRRAVTSVRSPVGVP